MAIDIIDFFKADGYSMLSLTSKMEKIPYNPQRCTSFFEFEGVSTTTILLEIEDQVISLVQSTPRGSGTQYKNAPVQHNRVTFVPAHLEIGDSLLADSLLGVRTIGGSEQEAIDTALARKMAQLKLNLNATFERQAASAIFGGIVLDADGSTLIDLNTAFGVTRPHVDMLLTTDATNVRAKCVEAVRVIRDALKGVPHTGVTALCGRNFWDALIDQATVKDTFKYQEGQALRANLDFVKFVYGGITFELYDTYVGPTAYLNTDTAVAMPTGVPNNYQWFGAPSDRMQGGVGTLGVPIYTWQRPLEDDKGLWVASQANPAFVVRRPEAMVTLHKTT